MLKYFKLAINVPSALLLFGKWFSIAWVENYINPALEYFSSITGVSMQVLEGIVIGGLLVGSLFWLFGRFWAKPATNAEEGHRYYVAKKIVDSKADALLALSDALQNLRELDMQLVGENRVRKIRKPVLIRMQKRLREDWRMRPSETYDGALTIQAVQDAIAKTVRQNKLKFTKENENTMAFMLHVAGILDDEGLGISERREQDERFTLVNKLKAKVSTDALRNAIRIFMWYSLGINSMMLLVAYFPTDSVQQMMKALGKTSAELKGERDQTLSYLSAKINHLLEQELYGKWKVKLRALVSRG